MSRPTTENTFADRSNALQPSASNTIASISQACDVVLVRLSLAIISATETNGQPHMQLLTPLDQRIPVPLGQLRTFPNVRRSLQQLLQATMTSHGIQATQMSKCAAIVPASRQPNNGGLLGVTDNEAIWRTYTNTIESMYHPPCNFPETCQLCREPAFVVACFPADAFGRNPGRNIAMIDGYSQEHGEALRRLSRTEQQRYIRIIERQVTARSAPSAVVQTLNSNIPRSQSPRPSITQVTQQASTDPTKGPKGRTLVGGKTLAQRAKDYSKGTLRPATAEQGIKAQNDSCLTCIKYNRKCSGTTMKLVPSSRKGRASQWKCDQCRNPQRRCLWRTSMDKVTTYEDAFQADDGRKLDKNTVQGRKERAEKKSGVTKQEQTESDDEEEEADEDEDEDEDENYGEDSMSEEE